MKNKFELKWNMIFIPVHIKTRNSVIKKLNFLFDTGAGKSEMSHAAAERIGYSSRDGIRDLSITTVAGKVEGFLIELPELKVFDTIFKNFPIGVFDIALTRDDREIDGLIGMDIISKFKILIDGPKGIISRG